jgi:hypothetical protein
LRKPTRSIQTRVILPGQPFTIKYAEEYNIMGLLMHIIIYMLQGSTKRVAVAAPLPGNFSKSHFWQEIFEYWNVEIYK